MTVEGLEPCNATGVVEKVQVGAGEPPGSCEEQESEMFAVKVRFGVRVISYDAGCPAITTGTTGAEDMAKELTCTGVAVAVFENPLPTTSIVPLLLSVPGPVGVRLTVTVAVPPPLMIPRLHRRVLLVGVDGQVPPDADADTKFAGALPLAPPPRLS